jgi:uncharacterized membrane protein YgaE (UPF0421/DUF939 family)
LKLAAAAFGSFLSVLLLCKFTGAPIDLAILAVIVSFSLGQESRNVPILIRIAHTLLGFLITVGLAGTLHSLFGSGPAFFASLAAIIVGTTLLGIFGGMWSTLRRVAFRAIGAMLFFPLPMMGHLANLPGFVIVAAGISVIWNFLVSFLPAEAGGSRPERTPSKSWNITSLRAAQQGLGMTLTLVVGYWLFPHEVPWAFITAYMVSVSVRTRGELIVKSGSRLFGAIGGAVAGIVSIPLINVVGPWIALILLSVLVLASFLRQFSYVWWSAGLTLILTILYSLLDPTTPVPAVQRLLGITLGAVAAVSGAFFIPLPTRRIVRVYLGRILAELDVVLSFLPKGSQEELNTAYHHFTEQVQSFYEVVRSAAIHLIPTTWHPAASWTTAISRIESSMSDLMEEANKEPRMIDEVRIGQLRRNNVSLRKQVAGRESSPLEELKSSSGDSRSEKTLTKINEEMTRLSFLII